MALCLFHIVQAPFLFIIFGSMDDFEVEPGVTLTFPTEYLDELLVLKTIMCASLIYMGYKGVQVFN